VTHVLYTKLIQKTSRDKQNPASLKAFFFFYSNIAVFAFVTGINVEKNILPFDAEIVRLIDANMINTENSLTKLRSGTGLRRQWFGTDL